MKRAMKKWKHKGRTITLLPSGSYQPNVYDSQGNRHRKSYDTLDEAKAKIDEIEAKKTSGQQFLRTAAHTTFKDAIALRRKELLDLGRSKNTLDRFDSICDTHLEKAFGHRRLIEFVDARAEFVKTWLGTKKDEGYEHGTLSHLHNGIKKVLEAAITEGKMAPPNPITAYQVRVPHVDKKKRVALPLDDVTALARGAMTKADREQELAFLARQLMVSIGLQAPLRTGELCGLCWDCLDFEDRIIFIRREVIKVHKNAPGARHKWWSLEDTTKTDEGGFRDIPMSPIVHAVLLLWRDRLAELGYPTSGRVPVLRTKREAMLVPTAVSGNNHWDKVIDKAELVKETGANKYVFYNLRHTVCSILRTMGMEQDDLQDLMGHEEYETTKKHYKHKMPEYMPLRREFEDLGFERTAEGFLEGLGIILARRWIAEGIIVPCSQPRSMSQRQQRLPNYHDDEPKALEGPVLDLTPTAVAMEPASAPISITSLQGLREWQGAEAKRLVAPPYSWSRKRISEHLGICESTLSQMVGAIDGVKWMRKTTRAARAKLEAHCLEMLDRGDGRDGTAGIAAALGVRQTWVIACASRHGRSIGGNAQRRRRSRKMDQHEARIRELIAEGRSDKAIAEELCLGVSSVNAFIVRRGLRPSRWVRIEPHHEAHIVDRVAVGKKAYAIAKELGLPPSTVSSFIKRRNIQIPGNELARDAAE
jgi:integrase/DNA-binding CsgD family transcriptional regulator